jgi:XRE family aerobic/anaerobic benzoate catabolism transcriptional regulator
MRRDAASDMTGNVEISGHSGAASDSVEARDPFLIALGERLRGLRSRRGLTRKALARLAEVSERHLANVESGVGNASIQFLRQLTTVLNCTLAEMIGDETATSPEWLMIREILRGRSDEELAQARSALTGIFEAPTTSRAWAGCSPTTGWCRLWN